MVEMEDTTTLTKVHGRSYTRRESVGRPNVPDQDLSRNCSSPSSNITQSQTVFVKGTPMPALAAVDIKAHDLEWARNRQRRRSASDVQACNSIDDEKSICPQSERLDAPPVPALPSLDQVRWREAQITNTRPRSMIVDVRRVLITSDSQQANYGEEINERAHRLRDLTLANTEDPEEPTASAQEAYDFKASYMPKMVTEDRIPGLWNRGLLEKKNKKFAETSEPEASSDKVLITHETLPADNSM